MNDPTGRRTQKRLTELFRSLPGLVVPIAYDRLFRWCLQYIKNWHRQGLGHDDCEDIVAATLHPNFSFFFDAAIPAEIKAETLLRLLERDKKRLVREHQRLVPFDPALHPAGLRGPEAHPSSYGEAERLLALAQAEDVLATCFRLFAEALPTLRDKDHDLLVELLDLREEGFAFRCPSPLGFTSAEAYAKACYRARRRFRQAVEKLLEFELASAREAEANALQMALQLVRSSGFEQLLRMKNEWAGRPTPVAAS